MRTRVTATLAGSPLQGKVTGPAGVLTDLVTIFRSVDLKLLATTIGLVFVLLILMYRSPLLALLPLLLAELGLYTALAPALILAILVMLLAGLTLVPALILWVGRAAYWPQIPRYQVQAAPVAITQRLRGFWGRLGGWVARHRVVSSALVLLIFALGNIGSQPSLNFLTSFRAQADSTSGYALLQQHFAPGTLAPTTILLQLRGAQPDAYQHLVQLDEVTADLQHLPGVASVAGPTRPAGGQPAEDVATLQTQIAALPPALRANIRAGRALPSCQASNCAISQEEAVTIGLYAASLQDVSRDSTAVSLTLVLRDDPYSLQAIDQVQAIQQALNRSLAGHGLGPQASTSARAYLVGQTAQLVDTLQDNQHDTQLVVPVVLALTFLVLALLLRSLVAPLYLLAAVALNFLAAIGLCGFVFQRIEGQDGFNYAIPLYTFIFLVALGADYTIFLMSRVREEANRHGFQSGVPFAVSRTGGVITSAGLILAGTFLVLTTLPLTLLYQLGVCVAVGVLLDTFVVRGLLVPGLVLLLERWNWWPGRMTKPESRPAGLELVPAPPEAVREHLES